MKLLYCHECQDVLRLQKHPRTCECGASGGHYINELDAIFWGKATPLGFDNPAFHRAMEAQPQGPGPGSRFTAFVIPVVCDTLRRVEVSRSSGDDHDHKAQT